MQIRSDFTKEEILNHPDPLLLTCHPLNKIKLLADFILTTPHGEVRAGNVLNQSNLDAVYEMLEDARQEIEYIVNTSNEVWREEHLRTRMLEQTLKDFIPYLEDPDDKPDLKYMAADLRKVLNN